MAKLFVYAQPKVMTNHRFSDDVAITEAETEEEAVEKFRKLYDLSDVEVAQYVDEVYFNDFGVAILTEY